ncbi:hypothetical protein [Streptomyces noursei]|uniref:hypothetical protein n=1 Tax=Streptomyces noursei TaxID=1971 RepID=UPI0021A7DA9E|nr:hypothetical protein [Streptomyces noursei]UWS69895.1 hypothetical protein N1H47_00605 [Streptomyces noursei]
MSERPAPARREAADQDPERHGERLRELDRDINCQAKAEAGSSYASARSAGCSKGPPARRAGRSASRTDHGTGEHVLSYYREGGSRAHGCLCSFSF